jgi:hypothetical protein
MPAHPVAGAQQHESLGALQRPRSPNLTHAASSVVGILSKLPVVPNDVAQAGLETVTTIDQQTRKLRVHEGMTPLRSSTWESDPLHDQSVNSDLEHCVVASVRRVVEPASLELGPGTGDAFLGLAEERPTVVDHAASVLAA